MIFDEWSPELVAALDEPFAPSDHKDKTQGGSSITFVDVHKYKERLNATVGPHGWSCTVRLEPIGNKMICTVALTVLGVTKENVGDEVEIPEVNARGNERIIGSPATNSYAQAFKRACSDFGLGAYLYDEARRSAAKRGASAGPRAVPNKPVPPTMKQIELLDRLMKSSVWTQDEKDAVADNLNGADKTKVSRLIDRAQAVLAERKAAS